MHIQSIRASKEILGIGNYSNRMHVDFFLFKLLFNLLNMLSKGT